MAQLPFVLFGFLIFLLVWAATGHGIWLLCVSLLRGIKKRSCPECREQLAGSDKACRKCGWTSRPVSRSTATRVCQFALNAAYERGIIDRESLDRGTAALQQLDQSPSGEARAGSASPTLTLPPGTFLHPMNDGRPADVEATEGTLNPVALAATTSDDPTLVDAMLVPNRDIPYGAPLASISDSSGVSPNNSAAPEFPPVLGPAAWPQPPQPHALDRDYLAPPKPAAPRMAKIKQTWGKWLNAFMEEKNIQWGELAGGLLILCCSTALVLSFWEHIASRPWLKFSIFTGINAAILGLGLNACHRWKLPTTSRGILMIGLLLLPLNFLAFAIFTLGAPWDWWTVIGECLSLGLLGCLAWFAAKVVTPQSEAITTATVVGFAIANLLVRRLVDAESGTLFLSVCAFALVSFYVLCMLIGKRSLFSSERFETNALFRLLGLGSFGFLIAFGLLLGCSRTPLLSIHYLSPLFWIAAIPSLVYSMSIGHRAPQKSQLLLASILLGSFAMGFACFGLVLAWPMPLLMVASLIGVGVLVAFIAKEIQSPKLGFVWYMIGGCVAVIGWHVARGHVALLNEDWQPMLRGLASADTGFVLVAWSAVCLALSAMLSKLDRTVFGLVALKSGGLTGIVGTILLTVFGFGRHEYATSVALIYLIYAIVMIVVSSVRGLMFLDVMAGVFVVAACFQGIVFGWLQEAGILASTYWSLTAAALILIVAQSARKSMLGISWRKQTTAHEPLAVWYRGIAILDLAIALLWLVMSESGAARPEFLLIGVREIVLLAAIWVAISWLASKAVDWSVAQLLGMTAGLVWVHHYAKTQSWYEQNPYGFVHPLSLQLDIAWIAIFASLGLLAVAIVERWESRLQAADASPSRFKRMRQRFIALNDYSIAPWLSMLALFGFVCLAYYGAAPGSVQELMPRDGLTGTQSVQFEVAGETVTRLVPDIAELEFAALPHRMVGWNTESIASGLAGLPRMFWLWFTLCLSLAVGNWSQPSRLRSCGLVICILSIAIPLATRWESDIAVASALRWTTSLAFGMGCFVLCGWYVVRASKETSTPENLTMRFDSYFATLVASLLIPLILLGVVVIVATIPHFMFDSTGVVVSICTGLLAVCGAAVFLLASRSSVKFGAGKYGITATVMLVAPFLAWFVLQIVLALVAHPFTGPNGNSIFIRIGLASSYTIPISILAIGLIANSVVRRSPVMAFASCLVLLLSGLAGFMLTFKSEGLKPTAWVGLLATLTIISGGFALVWNWYSQRKPLGWLSRIASTANLEEGRNLWRGNLLQIANGFLGASVCLTAILIFISGTILNRLEVFALLGVVSLGVAFAADWYTTKETMWHWWFVAVSFLTSGCLAGVASNATLAIELPCVVLLGSGAIMAWLVAKPAKAIEGGLMGTVGERIAMSLPLVQSFFLALRMLPIGNSELHASSILVAVSAISLIIGWRTGRFGFGVGAIVAAQTAALVHTSSAWGGTTPGNPIVNTLLLQISTAILMSFFCSLAGFATSMRFLHGAAICLLAVMSAVWYLVSLNALLEPFSAWYYAFAILVALVGSISRYWTRPTKVTDLMVYVSALCSVILFFQFVHAAPKELHWISTLGFAAFCLASSFVWRASDRILDDVNRTKLLPALAARSSSMVVIVANTLLAFGVVGLAIAAQFFCESQPLRLASSQAIMAVAFAIGLLARYKDDRLNVKDGIDVDDGSRIMRFVALIFGVIAAVALGWHFDSIENINVLNRLSYASLSTALMGMVYGYALIKWIGLSERWCDAALSLMPYLLGAAAVGVCVVLVSEWSLGYEALHVRVSFAAIVCILLALIASIAASLAAALIPGRDPFGLTERGRTAYVYVSEALLVLLVMHIRLTMPWLFAGWVQAIWPLLIIGLAFVGLGVSEWSKRTKFRVLSEPLERSGMVLPILPLLTHWLVPSQVDYGISLLCASIAYASFGYLRKSMLYWGASVVTGNGALWYGLHNTDFRFVDHPQLWVIPPALSILVILQVLRERLPREQVAAARYIATGSIYVASTAEVFIQGISAAPWLPIVLAGLSIGGIFAGIALRIRAILWLGLMFLCVAMFTVIWHAAVDLAQTWVWYVSGIVMGILILTMFALFEKRREQLKGLVSKLQTWDD
ncbi:MAG: hypothetical protein NTY15_13530 [Planctomycetota bacterium]|nr:hypothetical protein [Planctomycetota bacterium]